MSLCCIRLANLICYVRCKILMGTYVLLMTLANANGYAPQVPVIWKSTKKNSTFLWIGCRRKRSLQPECATILTDAMKVLKLSLIHI